MTTYNLEAWTGPCHVAELAQKCREAGLTVTCEGTEKIYVLIAGEDRIDASLRAEKYLNAKHGTHFGLRFQ